MPAYYCPKCEYDLRGSTGDRCPECGGEASDKYLQEILIKNDRIMASNFSRLMKTPLLLGLVPNLVVSVMARVEKSMTDSGDITGTVGIAIVVGGLVMMPIMALLVAIKLTRSNALLIKVRVGPSRSSVAFSCAEVVGYFLLQIILGLTLGFFAAQTYLNMTYSQ